MIEQQRDYVLRTVEERGIRLVRLWFTDVLGNLKSFAISPAEMENALNDGMSFDGSAIDGFSRVQESDVLALPTQTPLKFCRGSTLKAPKPECFAISQNLTARHLTATQDKCCDAI